jgi:hypothetical protein
MLQRNNIALLQRSNRSIALHKTWLSVENRTLAP